MMIEKHISALLYRYQCVIVPGFGAFLTETSSARFNELTGTFSPPKKMISFNSQLKNNDGLLANHIALEKNLSYNEVLILIKENVSKWNETLENNTTLYLKNIGELVLNQDQKIIFEPIGSTNYLTSSFGLSSILVSNLERNTERKTSFTEKETIVIPIQKAKKSRGYLKYAAVVVLGLGLWGSISTYQQNLAFDSEKSEIEKQVQLQVQNKIQQATFFIETPKIIDETPKIIESKVTETVVEKKYHIVAGSFRTEAKAQILVDQLREKGYVNAKQQNKSQKRCRWFLLQSYVVQSKTLSLTFLTWKRFKK